MGDGPALGDGHGAEGGHGAGGGAGDGRGRAGGESGDGASADGAGSFAVRGGAGGTRATLDSIAAAAGSAAKAAEALGSAAECVRRAQAGPWPAEVLGDVNRGSGGLPSCADRASFLALALRMVARTYADADDDARARLRAVTIVAGGMAGDLGPTGWTALGLGAGVLTVAGTVQVVTLRALQAAPGLAGLVLRALPDLSWLPGPAGWAGGAVTGSGGLLPDGVGLPHGADTELVVLGLAAFALGALPGRWRPTARPIVDLTRLMTAATAGWGVLTGRPRTDVVVAPLLTPSRRKEVPPTGVGDVMRRVAELSDAPGPTVGVQRLDHADGSTSWVVSVPGTRSQAVLPGANPMDNATNLALMGGTPDAMTEAVEVAMLRAGVGPDDPVVLAGHSQGGMVATRLAASLQRSFDVEAVLTAGSPVGSMPVPSGVAALHLEHAQDYVPALDGLPNPDAVNRTTVVRTLPGGDASWAGTELGLLPSDVGPAHGAWLYAETASSVERLDDPSVRGFERVLDRVLGDGTARVTSRQFLVARVPERADGGVKDGGVKVGWPAADGASRE